jgi:hypothetical protein
MLQDLHGNTIYIFLKLMNATIEQMDLNFYKNVNTLKL